MYNNSLYFKIKDNVECEKYHLIELFFQNWIDSICDKRVEFNIVGHSKDKVGPDREIFSIQFQEQEDVVILKLKGIPEEFQEYIELM